jgi:hypothetical protein
MKISVIPSDKTIVKDLEGLNMVQNPINWPNDVPSNIHAYQYDSENPQACGIEYNDGTANSPCTLADVQKFIDAHESEKARLQQIADDEYNSWDRVRQGRDSYLYDTDYTQVEDSPLTAEKVSEFATYRQNLRDLPSNYSGEQPRNITFYEGDVMLTASDGSKSVIIAKPTI